MAATNTEPARTGNAVLDAIADDHVRLKSDLTAVRDELRTLRESGADLKIVNRLEQLEKGLTDFDANFRGMAERVASIDTGRSMDAKDVKKFSIARCAVALYATKHRRAAPGSPEIWKEIAPFEFDVLESTERESRDNLAAIDKMFGSPSRVEAEQRRDMVSTVDSQGAVLIPTPAAMNHLEYLRSYLPLIPLGARVRSDLTGLKVPIDTSMTGGTTAYWVGENATPTKSDAAFAINYAQPHRLAARTHISNLLLRNSLGEVRQRVEQDLPRAMAEAFETAALFGTGSAFQPRGLESYLSAASRTSTLGPDGNTGGRFRWQQIAEAQRRLMDRKVRLNPATTGFVCSPIVEQLLRTQAVEHFSSQGEDLGMPVVAPYMSLPALKEIVGRYEASQIIPTDRTKGSATGLTPVIYGDWSQLNLCQWGGYRMRASDVASDGTNHAFVQDFTFIIVEGEVDALPSRDEAFHEFTDCLTVV